MNQTPAPQTNDAPSGNSYVDDYQPPASTKPKQSSAQKPTVSSVQQPPRPSPPKDMPAQTKPPSVAKTKIKQQSLQDQDIFVLLGADKGAPEQEKEAFLDELQQVIWEDFLENDVELLVTSDELTTLKDIMKKGKGLEVQEEIVVYLEKLIPDLEEIMIEKALELKEDLVRERAAGMREYYASKTEVLSKIDQAEQAINHDQWQQAAELLNSIN